MFFDEFTRVPDAAAEKSMYPSSRAKYGFLMPRERLAERIAKDQQRMAELELDCGRIATRIEEIFASTGESWNGHALLRPMYIAGMLCPWNDFLSSNMLSLSPEVREIIIIHRDKLDESIEIMERVKNPPRGINTDCYGDLVREGVAMILSDLHPHLLREHQFCEGENTPYRIAPDRVREYLGDM